jgi:undecaprenyl diphosphate synthase
MWTQAMTQPVSTAPSWCAASAGWPEPDRALLAAIRPDRLPRHVAIIMDGNGRWARGRGFADRIRGHEAGIDAVREATRTCAQLGIEVLTLYAFSKENWRRPGAEVGALMELLTRFLVGERDELMENNIRLRMIGCESDLPPRARKALGDTRALTAGNGGMILNLALSYGGRDELTRAVRRIAEEVRAGRLEPEAIDEALIGARLDTAGMPDPDLLVRTSGELRTSNFLPWQAAYVELYVTPVLWPDFRRRELLEAVAEFGRRERRYGGVGEPPVAGGS